MAVAAAAILAGAFLASLLRERGRAPEPVTAPDPAADRAGARRRAEPSPPPPAAPAPPAAGKGDARPSPAAPPRISGVVVEAGTGTPVARLPLTFSSPGRAGAFATTRDDGTFETRTPLPAGEVIVIDGSSYAGLSLSLDAEHRNLVLARLVLEAGKSVEGLVIEHPFSGRAAGRVANGSGAAVPGARVFVLLDARSVLERGPAAGRPEFRRATTGESGAFAFDRLPTDRRLELFAEAPGYSTGFSEPFVASPHGTEVADIVLLRPGSLRLLALDAEGAPLPGARAHLFRMSASDGVPRRTFPDPEATGDDGVLSIDALPPGRYAIEMRRPPHVFRGAATATVEEGERAEVTVHAEAVRLAISGTVTDPASRPLPDGLAVEAAPAGTTRLGARADVDPDGRFTVEVPEPGGYRLVAARSALDAGPAVDAAAGDADVRLAWTEPAARVRVRVLDDATGEPIAGAEVRLAIDGGPPALTAPTDPGGRTEAFPVAPARGLASAAARGAAPRSAAFEIEPGDVGERTIEIRLGPGRIATGRVIDSDGNGVAHARVAVADGGLPWLRTRVTTRADGTFTIDSLPEEKGEVALVEGDFIVARAVAEPGAGEIVLVAPARR